ncbi:hypothetical protein PGF_00002000 [Porphyromonas gingivalis 381]|nr:hypothetical protein PGF_00002000 [Porphyromonas gingivalis 381]
MDKGIKYLLIAERSHPTKAILKIDLRRMEKKKEGRGLFGLLPHCLAKL